MIRAQDSEDGLNNAPFLVFIRIQSLSTDTGNSVLRGLDADDCEKRGAVQAILLSYGFGNTDWGRQRAPTRGSTVARTARCVRS